MAQTWRDLLFAHWALEPDVVRPVLPDVLPLDTFEGRAWIAVTPFEVTGLRGRGLPPLPGTARFPELNLRTYTTLGGKPGIYFLSLDAANALAVLAARRTYLLPYFTARMRISRHGQNVHYVSHRISRDGQTAGFEATYAPSGPPTTATPGTLEYFLTERYCLYTLGDRPQVYRADIQHPPWPLRPATATLSHNTMTGSWRIGLPAAEPVLHFATLQQVLIWPLRPVETT
jgi:uncharacterized protein YqjF (DUF2071 family)